MQRETYGAFFGLALVACGGGGGDKPAPTASPPPATAAAPAATAPPAAAPKPTAAAAAAPPASASASPSASASAEAAADDKDKDKDKKEKGKYSRADIKAIPDDCKSPHLLLANAPFDPAKDKKKEFHWDWARQALRANPQLHYKDVKFSTVDWSPKKGDKPNAKALVARCGNGRQCNELAAMYKTVVRTSHPELVCGAEFPNMSHAEPAKFEGFPGGAKDEPKETVEKCVRLAACKFHREPTIAGDPALECQKAPAKFKLDCAKKPTCDEVNACAAK